MNKDKANIKTSSQKKKNPWLKWSLRGIVSFFLLFFLASVLLQFPVFQNVVAKWITGNLSKRLQTELKIEKVNISISKGFILNGVYLEDESEDTLLYAKQIYTTLNRSLISAFKNQFDINGIRLDSAVIKIRLMEGDSVTNLEKILGRLGSQSGNKVKESASPDLQLNLKNVFFNKLDLEYFSEIDSSSVEFTLEKGNATFNLLDIKNKRYDIESLYLLRPHFQIMDSKTISEKVIPSSNKVNSDQNPEEVISKIFPVYIVHSLEIEDGLIEKVNTFYEETDFEEKAFNKDFFSFSELDLGLNELKYIPDSSFFFAHSIIANTNLHDNFSIRKISMDSLKMTALQIAFNNLNLLTDESSIQTHLVVDFDDLNEAIKNPELFKINNKIDNIGLSLNDLRYFIPSIKEIPIFANSANEKVQLRGEIFGTLNDLSGNNIDLTLGRTTRFKGNINTRNLTQKGNELFNLKIDMLRSNVPALRRLIPGFNPPKNYDNLGNILFKGRYDGYFKDFVAYGNIKTDLGEANLDMRLDVKDGNDYANYSGYLDLNDFDLGAWSENSDLGVINLSANIADGKGLNLENAAATLDATVHSFLFKGYNYKNLVMSGSIDKNRFNGDLTIEDVNVDFNFNGQIVFQDSTSSYQFTASVNNLDLEAINLLDRPLKIKGDLNIDMAGRDLREITGQSIATNLVITDNNKSYTLDTVNILSSKLNEKVMAFGLQSEIMDLSLIGIFDLREFPGLLSKILKKNYPYHTKDLAIELAGENETFQDFSFELDINDTKDFLEIANIKSLRITDTHLKGTVNNAEDKFDIEFNAPLLAYDKFKIFKVNAKASNLLNKGGLHISIDTSYFDNRVLNPIELTTSFEGDTILFDFKAIELLDSLEKIVLSGKLIPHERGYDVKIEKDEWLMLGSKWDFNPGNKIVFGPKFIDISNLSIGDGKREIIIDDIDQKGLSIHFNSFDFRLLNKIINYDKMTFTGKGNTSLNISNIYEKRVLSGKMDVADLKINGDSFGKLSLELNEFQNEILDLSLNIDKGEQQLSISGLYNIPGKYLTTTIDILNYPMSIFEYIIQDGISGTRGLADVRAYIEGDPSNLKLTGDAMVYGGGVRVDYLGTYYTFDKQSITIDENFVNLSNAILTDSNGNTAQMTGGLTHDFFTNFQLALNIASDKFIAINTTKQENPLYYGFGQGNVSVDFSGPFDATNIRVTATTGEDTRIAFPIATTQTGYDESFIKFSREDYVDSGLSFEEEFKLLGLDFEMNLEITDEAHVEIIFNEQVGEILQGNGRGNVSIFIKRSGDFDVFGQYEIETGEYLFTAYGFVAKPFEIERGGILTWDGDPFDANLDIKAEYKGLRAPLSVFLAEYLLTATPLVEQEAKGRTNVDLKLILGGTLFNPIVNFDINFPDVTGELKSYTDNKMRTLRVTENGINNQVVGLLVFRNFLPYDNPLANISGNSLLTTGSSTLTEFFTSQLSILLTDVIQQQLDDDSFIQAIDLDIGLNENTNVFSENTQNINLTPDEVDVNSRYRFKNEDFVLNTGVNYVWGSSLSVGNYLVGDVVLEWFISDDRRLKFKFYSKYDYDEALSSRKLKNGFGISFRKEFGSLSGFKKVLQDSVNEAKANSSLPN